MEAKTKSTAARDYSTWELVRRLLALAWRFRADCILSVAMSLGLLVLGLVGLQFLGLAVDVIRHALDPAQKAPVYPFGWRPPAAWQPLTIVCVLSLGIVLQAILRAWLTYKYNMVTAWLTQGKIVPELRHTIYDKLQRLSFRFFDTQGSGSIFNRVTGDVQNTRLFVDGVVLQGVNMVLTLVVYFVFMWSIHPGLTLACLSTTVGIWWVTHHYSGRLRPAYLRNRELYDQLVLTFSESVRGMQTLKGFGAEDYQARRFADANQQVSGQQKRIFFDISVFTPATQLLSQLSLVVLFAYGGWLYVQGRISLGSGLVVFAGLMQQFNGQIANITTIANSVQQSFTAARRVFEVFDTPSEVEAKPGARPAPMLSGAVEFQNVTFAYTSGTPVLHRVSFETAPGQMVGIFGSTGAGKSSLLGLLPRFYDPQEGRVVVDGVDIRDLELDSYRRQIGIVYQESFLFSNTVAANIAFGNPAATREEIERAARTASAHEFIMQMPAGYDTVLGEAGVDLSGGQRQRLALARALLLQPRILILDDPTASVDPKTEHEIVSALRHALRGRTAFVVANRLSLLRRADLILVLDKGQVLHRGTHAELAAIEGPYRETALLQMPEFDRDAELVSSSAREEWRTMAAAQ